MSDNNESQSKDAVVKACWAEQVELRPIQANSKIYFTIKPTETGWDICIPEDVTLTEAAQRFIAAVDEMRGHSSKPATSTTQWISVKDRLPEGYDLTEDDFKPYVLVRDARDGIHVAAYEHCLRTFKTSATCSAYEEDLYLVTHWMPLPPPPTE